MRRIRPFAFGTGLSVLAALSACTTVDAPVAIPDNAAANVPNRAALAPSILPPSQASLSAAAYYRSIEQRAVAQGLMRQDGGGIDTRYSADDLATNFQRIALMSEHAQVGGRFVSKQSLSPLRRWQAPVRIKVHFGGSAPEDMRAKDRANLRAYVARLSRLTRHPISLTESDTAANFHLFVVSLDEQRALGPVLNAVEPDLAPSVVREITSMSRNTYCAVFASSRAENPYTYVSGIAFVRTEHPDLMRLSCYHEELAQGLGLANDSPKARPSIFNDDEEFALLTTMDEQLLRMLYHPSLKPGMTVSEAAPIVSRLAENLVGGNS